MKDKWVERYRDSVSLVNESADALVAFNVNIDVLHDVENLDLDLDEQKPELNQVIDSKKQLEETLSYCVENSENMEVELGDWDLELDGEERIGGQAGIISNYLAKSGNGVIFYTSLLSQEVADMMDEKLLYPALDGDSFVLKNVRDASNTDRTKKNHILEFSGEKTGRLIVSDKLKGAGPYFRKGVEENIDQIEDNIDCLVLGGFHNIEGNREAKLKKSVQQLQKFEKPVHIEYVHRNDEIAELLFEHIFPEADSLGIDESELKSILEVLEIEHGEDEISLGHAFDYLKTLIDRFGFERIHLHTYRYLVCVEKEGVEDVEKVRKAMLFGEVSAIQKCSEGTIPGKEEIKKFDMEGKQLQDLEELAHFGDFFETEEFEQEGIALIDGYQVVAIPPLIAEEPEQTVGMGDIISAGSFVMEKTGWKD